MTVAIIDYGSGNLHSAHKAFERAAREAGLDREVKVTSRPGGRARRRACRAARRRRLRRLPARPRRGRRHGRGADARRCAGSGKPFLGICVGAQLLATRGLEYEIVAGLGWIPGDVAPIKPADPALKIPHMGWNTLDVKRAHPVLDGIRTGPRRPARLFRPFLSALRRRSRATSSPTADYGGPVTAIVARDNIVGTQFHPEKSQTLGLTLIANFLKWRP